MAQKMITVITPFSRKENIDLMANSLKGKVNWIVLIDNPELKDKFPEWVTVKLYDTPLKRDNVCVSNVLFNRFLSEGLGADTQYMILCDDDSIEEGFWDKIPNEDIVIVSMKRSDREINHVIWTDWKNQMGYWENSIDILQAEPKNMTIGAVGGEQLIIKGKILRNFRYGLSNVGDGEMICKIVEEHGSEVKYIPNAYVLFNYFEDGRYTTFSRGYVKRDKPVVLFVGDYFCAGHPSMGLSEWEGNIWSSLESTGLAAVARFHFDKYYYHTGKRADTALIERIDEIKPDYIVLIIYKHFGQDPAVMLESTIKVIQMMGVPIITIWGDLEAQQQRDILKTVEPYCHKVVGTASKAIVETLGHKYMHVPKDPRIFNNPNKERDIDVVFSGSYGLGREERQEVLQYLIDNGIKLVVGGSEGRDHFSTEEYAERYKRAKIAISFSRAHGVNVVNARPFEAMSCGAMLIEQDSPELCKLFEVDKEFKMWITKVDLLETIKYYLSHEEERYTIAKAGQERIERDYSAKKFWESVFGSNTKIW